MAKKNATKKKPTKSSSKIHNRKVNISINSTTDFEKELKEAGKPSAFHFESHPFVIGILTILLILFITAAILSYISFTTTVDAVVANMDEENEDVIDMEEIIESEIITVPETIVIEDSSKEPSSSELAYVITCDSEYTLNPCKQLSDGDDTTQWLAAYSCADRKRPCAVNNKITITAEDSFSQVSLLNRVEKDFYINRLILKYNGKTETKILGPVYSQEYYVADLSEPTDSLEVLIVEIVGSGNRYLAGLAEVSVN